MRRPWDVARDVVRLVKVVRENIHKGGDTAVGNLRVRESADTAKLVSDLREESRMPIRMAVSCDGSLRELWTVTIFEGGKEVREDVANVLYHAVHSFLHVMCFDDEQLTVTTLAQPVETLGDWSRKVWSIDAIKVDVRQNLKPNAAPSIPIQIPVVSEVSVGSVKSSATPPFRPQSAPVVGSGRSPQLPSSGGNDFGLAPLALPPATVHEDPFWSLAPIIDAPSSPQSPPRYSTFFEEANDSRDFSEQSRADQLHKLLSTCKAARLTHAEVRPIEMLNNLLGN